MTGPAASPQGPVTVEQLADDLAEVVRAVPGVSALHPGVLGEIGTYLPGRRVAGVRLREEALTAAAGTGRAGPHPVEVHVVLAAGAPVRETAAAVHAAVDRRLATSGLHPAVLVNVADIAVDPTAPAG
ncbi:hypothetical protein AB2L28_20180 [Kineococcus sp. TBRC 1896]|uniref:Asp23/Gls24 family envelope stress response protein n=1 Tax=Kineococcus mangrovi TaxID=1660183 RepID=A0ABV4IA16_9ACTN